MEISVKNRLESLLIEQCVPTLAGMKAASLFNYFFEKQQMAIEEIKNANEVINERGVYVEALCWKKNSVLIYVFRPKIIENKLEIKEIKELLYEYGYKNYNVYACIKYLKKRLDMCDGFPHEIGVFLDYPIEDVKGFIENKGKNCKICGMWKVYRDEKEKEKIFEKFVKCKLVYMKVFKEGRTLFNMTVFI